MRKRKEVLGYFAVGLTLFLLLNLPLSFVENLRSHFIFRSKLHAARGISDEEIELMQLRIENEALKNQISLVQNWLTSEERVEGYIKKIQEWTKEKGFDPFYRRRIEDLERLLSLEAQSVEAKVIFRDPGFWSSGLWVDKGEQENLRLGKTVIAKNSPVILGSSLVGIVEEVQETRSYVRLITDAQLTPAVRAVRGEEVNGHLLELIVKIVEELELKEGIQGRDAAITALEMLKKPLLEEEKTRYLAKGEIRGSSYPVWRQRSSQLKGIGFNYEFSDEEGASKTIHDKHREALLEKGDLLITSGLDGLFPRGLSVAMVTKILPLKEGGNSYEIEASATCPHLSDLSFVRICRPLH